MELLYGIHTETSLLTAVASQLLQALNFISEDRVAQPFFSGPGSIVSVVCSFVKPQGWSPIR